MILFKLLKLMVGVIAVSMTLSTIHATQANAAFTKPDVVQVKDTSQTAKVVKEGISFTLNVVMALGALGAAISLGMMAPFIGEPEKGKKGLKGSIIVIAGAGLFEMFMSWLIGVFF